MFDLHKITTLLKVPKTTIPYTFRTLRTRTTTLLYKDQNSNTGILRENCFRVLRCPIFTIDDPHTR